VSPTAEAAGATEVSAVDPPTATEPVEPAEAVDALPPPEGVEAAYLQAVDAAFETELSRVVAGDERLAKLLGLGLALIVIGGGLLIPGSASAKRRQEPQGAAFISGPWPDVRTDAAMAQQQARLAIERSDRLTLGDLGAVLDPTGDPDALAAEREANTAFRKGFIAFSNESWAPALQSFSVAARRTMDAASRLSDASRLAEIMQYAGAAAVRSGDYRTGIRWFHQASVLQPKASLNARGVSDATRDLYERVRRRATGLPPSDLRVLSEPDGASVYIDGRFVGVTPAVVPVALPGTHLLRVDRDGYIRQGVDVEVLPGPTEEVQFVLKPTKKLAKFEELLAAALPVLDMDDDAKASVTRLANTLGVDSIVLGRIEPRGEENVLLLACEYDSKGEPVGEAGSRVFGYRDAGFRQGVAEFFDALLAGDGTEDPTAKGLPPPPPLGESAVASIVEMDDGPPIYAMWWFWTGIGVVTAGGAAAGVAAALPSEEPKRKQRGELIFQF
jgi:hypothetical protein